MTVTKTSSPLSRLDALLLWLLFPLAGLPRLYAGRTFSGLLQLLLLLGVLVFSTASFVLELINFAQWPYHWQQALPAAGLSLLWWLLDGLLIVSGRLADANKLPLRRWNNAPLSGGGRPSSPRSKSILFLLCFVVGSTGWHRLYAGRWFTGLLMLLSLGGLGFWWLTDVVTVLCNQLNDYQGRPITNWSLRGKLVALLLSLAVCSVIVYYSILGLLELFTLARPYLSREMGRPGEIEELQRILQERAGHLQRVIPAVPE